jgi:hypothetical protein
MRLSSSLREKMRHPRWRTYGEDWRERARAGERLGSDEHRAWEDELAWDLEHAEEAGRLEALVGRKIRVLRELTCVDESVVPQGTMFFVRARARDRLLAWRPEWGVLLMREEWVSAVPTPPPSREPVNADESDEDLSSVVPPRWARRAAAVLGAGLDEDPIGDDGT